MTEKIYAVTYYYTGLEDEDDYVICYGYFSTREKAECIRNEFDKHNADPNGIYVVDECSLDFVLGLEFEEAVKRLKKRNEYLQREKEESK